MDRKTYTVTKRAGPRVAGRRATAGQTIELTEAEAASEWLSGAITPEGEDLHPAFTEKTKKVVAAQERANPDETPEVPAVDPRPAGGRGAKSSEAASKTA